jgi:hypothetical protein
MGTLKLIMLTSFPKFRFFNLECRQKPLKTNVKNMKTKEKQQKKTKKTNEEQKQ